eukprot:c23999_g1_i1 orf=623-2005(-)
MNEFFQSAKSFLVEVGEVFRETGHDAVYDFRDNALRGFGVPRLVSSLASLSVAGVAAVGTVSLSLELLGSLYVKRECLTCNGWEGLRCTRCGGTGKLQYTVSGLIDNGTLSAEVMAKAISDGGTKISYLPPNFDIGLPLPVKECPSCNSTGVMKCIKCKDREWKGKFSLDDVMSVPWKVWNVYQKTEPPPEFTDTDMEDPATAAFWLFARSELKGGFKYDEDVKLNMMQKYEVRRQYDLIRRIVAKRKPGWEELQKALHTIDPSRAMQDPVVIKNIPYYKARLQIMDEVTKLDVPPRPVDWKEKFEVPLRLSGWAEKELNDPLKREEAKPLLERHEEWVNKFLDKAWEAQWRQQKVEEVIQEKIQPYMEAVKKASSSINVVDSSVVAEIKPETDQTEVADPSQSKRESEVKAAAQKKAEKKQLAEEKKKKERQERAERMAKQAAEREAALARAKTETGKK